jgi:excinuclease UvrABC helicase subunit UvrB
LKEEANFAKKTYSMFQPVNSNFQPKGDQPNAIKKIVEGI